MYAYMAVHTRTLNMIAIRYLLGDHVIEEWTILPIGSELYVGDDVIEEWAILPIVCVELCVK